MPQGLQGEPVVLVTRSICDVIDLAEVLEWPRLVDERPCVGDWRIVVIRIRAVAHSGPYIRRTESRVPLLPFDGEVVLHRVRCFVVRVLSSGKADVRWPARSTIREDSRKDHLWIVLRVVVGRF